jgi:hypothetical protein
MRPEIATGSDPQRRVGGEEKWRRTHGRHRRDHTDVHDALLSLRTQSEFRSDRDRNSLHHAHEVFSEGTASEQ